MFVTIIFYDDCSDDHTIAVLLNFKAVIRSFNYQFITGLTESDNDVILAILSSDIRRTSRS